MPAQEEFDTGEMVYVNYYTDNSTVVYNIKNSDRIVFAGDSVTDMRSMNPVGEGLFDK